MGADCHMILETRNKYGTAWKFVKEIDIDRNYDFFDLLANVRGASHSPLSSDVGNALPTDLSKEAIIRMKLDWSDDNALFLGDHSFGTLTTADLLTYPYWDEVRASWKGQWEDYPDDNPWTREQISILTYHLVTYGKDARLVFGFDS